MSLEGRRIVITGASTGIGEATARQCVEAGARVVGLSRNIKEGTADGVVGIRCDVREEASVKEALDRAAEQLGGIDGLVANAGYGLYGHITKGNPSDWYDLIQTNVMGVLYTIFHGLQKFGEEGPRDVILMSSISGRNSRLGAGVYAASKFAVTAIGDSLRQELADRRIRVTLVEPATVDTPFYDLATRHEGAGIIARTFDPLTADDVARACVFAMESPPNVTFNVMLMRPNGQAT